MVEQVAIVEGNGDLGGSMRLGSYPAELLPRSVVAKQYGQTEVAERHRHRYEVNNAYRDQLEEAGSGDQRHVTRFAAGGVHRAAERRPPLLLSRLRPIRGTEVQADQTAPAVRGLDRGHSIASSPPDFPLTRDVSVIVLFRAELIDVPLSWPVASSRVLADGRIASFVEDQVHAPDGEGDDPGISSPTWCRGHHRA